jgi:glycine hydroxymethyltransferase
MVPFDTQSPFVTSGIRVGAPAMTTRGMGTEEFKHIADLMDSVIMNPESDQVISKVRAEIHELCNKFPLYDFLSLPKA